MKYSLLIILSFFTLSAFSQKKNLIVKEDGDTIHVGAITPNMLFNTITSYGGEKLEADKFKYAFTSSGREYITIASEGNDKKKSSKLYEVIMKTDKYYLVIKKIRYANSGLITTSASSFYYEIYDNKLKLIIELTRKNYDEEILKYFNDCNLFSKSVSDTKYMNLEDLIPKFKCECK